MGVDAASLSNRLLSIIFFCLRNIFQKLCPVLLLKPRGSCNI